MMLVTEDQFDFLIQILPWILWDKLRHVDSLQRARDAPLFGPGMGLATVSVYRIQVGYYPVSKLVFNVLFLFLVLIKV